MKSEETSENSIVTIPPYPGEFLMPDEVMQNSRLNRHTSCQQIIQTPPQQQCEHPQLNYDAHRSDE
jgi:hypothetical protein